MKNQKGITLVALTITVVIFTIILATITFSSVSSLQLRRLNNMYADINVVQGRLDNYYIKNNGRLPIYSDAEVSADAAMTLVQKQFNITMFNIGKSKENPGNVSERYQDVRKNPNDSLPTVDNPANPTDVTNPTYKIIKFTEQEGGKTTYLLGSFTLNNYYHDETGTRDYYLVNLQSHQVYYCTIGVDNIIAGVQASEDENDIRFSIPFEASVYADISGAVKDITGK